MILEYNGTQRPNNENWWTIQAAFRHNSLGLPQSILNRWIIYGTIVQLDANQASLKTKIAALESQFGVDGGDLKIFQSDGTTVTHHVLLNSASVDGVRVKRLEWLGVDPRQNQSGNEHVNKRTYRIIIESEQVDASASALLSWEESVVGIGTGGPIFVQKGALQGPPQRQIIQAQSSFYAIQRGRAVGYLNYPGTIASPIWPTDEHVERRRITTETPKFGPVKNTEFPISWSYEFESASQLTGGPTFF